MELEREIGQKKFRNETHKLEVNLIYTFNWLNAFNVVLFKRHNITGQQYNVLRILRGQHPTPVNIKLIRERMLDKMSDASRIVEKLRVKGFIERTVSSDDRRACDVKITSKGLQLLTNIDSQNSEFEKKFSTLSADEIKEMNRLLDKLRGNCCPVPGEKK
jgi:DNA-binding MarR family transcriptional regulator